MDLVNILNQRYSTKEFNSTKKISAENLEKLKTLLQMSPSSINLQPWHFIVAGSDEAKNRVAKGTQGLFQFNEAKVRNASHVFIFCAKTDVDEKYMKHLLEVEDKDGRYPNHEIKNMVYNVRNLFSNIHRYDLKDLQHWMEKQVYLNIGNFMLGAAMLGIDTLPMEGVDMKALDEEFGLREKGFTAVAVVAAGYRAENDFNIPEKTPKSRLPKEEIITILN